MRKTLSAFLLFLIPFISGCAGQNWLLAPSPPVQTHKVFTKQGSGETILYLDGEDWYGLIDLQGFTDIDLGLESIDQFLWRGNRQNINISIFAEQTKSSSDSDACLKSLHERMPYRRTTPVETKDLGGRKIMAYTSKGRKYIEYCPYYKGYCFNFHFSMKEKMPESAIAGVLDSIVFVDSSAIKVQLAKIFRVYDRSIQVPVPDAWKPEYKFDLLHIPAITFKPAEGSGFHVYLAPYWGVERWSVTEDQVVGMARKKMAKWVDRSPSVLLVEESHEKDYTIAYFDAEDKSCHPEDPTEFPFVRQGCVLLDGYVFSFTIMYREESRGEAKTATDAITHAKILDHGSVPTLLLP